MKFRNWTAGSILAGTLTILAWGAGVVVWVTRPSDGAWLNPQAAALDSPSPSSAATGDGPTPATPAQTPSPTPSGLELASRLADGQEAAAPERVPLFLQSGSAPGAAKQAAVQAAREVGPFGEFGPGEEPSDEDIAALQASMREAVRAAAGPDAPDGGLASEGRGHLPRRAGPEPRGATTETQPHRSSSDPPIRPGERVLDLPTEARDEAPPPPGRAYIRTGSIPVEQSLLVSGEPVSSFTLNRRFFVPGVYSIRLQSIKGCVEFALTVQADEIVYAIYDFEIGTWRRAERVGAGGRSRISPAVSPCQEKR